jgi:O-antigen/teichoic acid export membrane protein
MALEQIAEPGTAPMPQKAHKIAFFRQSVWMMITGLGSGFLMWGVHFLSKVIPESEYANMVTLMAVIMCIPAIPLQMVFAHQTAAGLATGRKGSLSGKMRMAWMGTFGLWAVAVLVILPFQHRILESWSISSPLAFWVMMLAVLLTLWQPMFGGAMQGQQNFLWLGWSSVLNGAGRLGVAAIFVFLFSPSALGILTGVAVGLAAAAVIGVWQTRDVWRQPSEPFSRRALLAEIVPLMLGFGATQFLFTSDTIFVNAYFHDQAAFYGAAGTLSRALVWLVAPMTFVMFPKIVHSSARAEKTDVMGLTLLATAVIAGCGVLGLWVLGPWVVRFVYRPEYVPVATSLLPWYAGAMLPLCLANVLVNNLLARSDLRIVVPLIVMALGYGLILANYHPSLVAVLQILAGFNILLLLLCMFFTWGKGFQKPALAGTEETGESQTPM